MKKKRSIIRILTNRSFQAERPRNRAAVLAIALTALMFTSIFVISRSMVENLQEMNFQQAGYNSHASTNLLTDEEAEKIISHEAVKDWGKTVILGVAENPELTGRQVEIRYGDENYVRSAFSAPEQGRMPEAADEIALDEITLEKLGIPRKLGEKVTLKWRRDLGTQEYTESTFSLAGYWEGNSAAMASMAWVSEDFMKQECAGVNQRQQRENGGCLGLVQLHLNLYSSRNLEQACEEMAGELGLPEGTISSNFGYSSTLNQNIFKEVLPMLVCVILVSASGYLIIYNIFQISVVSDIRFYGKLKTLGMSKKQLKKMIYGQADRLAVIGIPIGLLGGYFLGTVLVPFIITGTGAKAKASINVRVFVIAAVFSWVTVLVSCLKPARMAGKVSPMEALRYVDVDVAGKGKREKSRKGAGIPQMAWANLGRNRKRTVTVICSLTLGLVLLTAIHAKNASFDIDKYMSQTVISDFEVMDSSIAASFGTYDPHGTTISPQLLSRIESLQGLGQVGHLYSQTAEHRIGTSALQNIQAYYEAKDRLTYIEATDEGLAQSYHEMMKSGECTSVLYGIDGLILDTLSEPARVLEGEVDPEKFLSGGYCLAQAASGAEEQEKEVQPTYDVGDKVNIGGKEYEVMAVIVDISSLTEGTNGEGAEFLSFYLPADKFQELYPDHTMRKVFFDVEEEYQEQAENMLADYRKREDKSLNFKSKATLIEHYQEQTRAATIMAMSISLIIAFVGILNFINSMFTAIVSRQREFAMMQSIGMTKGQLRGMLICEGLYYAGITLAASYIFGCMAVGMGVRVMVSGDWTATFHFTVMPLVVCTPLLIAAAVLIPYLCFRNLEKRSIVERLRAGREG